MKILRTNFTLPQGWCPPYRPAPPLRPAPHPPRSVPSPLVPARGRSTSYPTFSKAHPPGQARVTMGESTEKPNRLSGKMGDLKQRDFPKAFRLPRGGTLSKGAGRFSPRVLTGNS